MKYIITIIILFVTFDCFSQSTQTFFKDSFAIFPQTTAGVRGYVQGRWRADTTIISHRDTIWHPLFIGTITTPDGATLYIWDGSKWNAISGGGGSTPTWQQTLIAGSDLTQNNSISFDNFYFLMQGNATSMLLNSVPGTESIDFNAGDGTGSSHFFMKGYDAPEHGWDLKGFYNATSPSIPTVQVSGNANTATLYLKADTININDAYKLPVIDGTANQVLTTDGAGKASWQDAGGSTSLFPISGMGTATGNVIGELAGNELKVTNSGNVFLDINTSSGNEGSVLQTTDGIGGGVFGVFAGTSSGYAFGMDVNNGVNDVSIVGDAPTNAITYTAATHTFNGDVIFSNNGSPDVGKVPTATDNAGNWTWQAAGGGTGLTRQIITSGSSGTVTGGNYIVTIDPASTLAAYTLTLPASPNDLEIVEIDFGGTLTSGTIVTALSVLPNSGQTIIDNTPPTSATADNTILYRYRASNTTWYRFKP